MNLTGLNSDEDQGCFFFYEGIHQEKSSGCQRSFSIRLSSQEMDDWQSIIKGGCQEAQQD